MDDHLTALIGRGFAWVRNGFPTSDAAFDAAHALIDAPLRRGMARRRWL